MDEQRDPDITFEEACKTMALSVADTVIQKHKDYGVDNILIFKEKGLIVRVWDKISRLKNIVWTGEANIYVPESLEDTWKDLAGYAIIGLMLSEGTFTNELEDRKGQG
tara:strand:- start:9127 stop:9450 length:324 start_codon:yes stop_codon:yes gene_type:complete